MILFWCALVGKNHCNFYLISRQHYLNLSYLVHGSFSAGGMNFTGGFPDDSW
jgi:hypothetical protein